jgi:hypothetical protein
MLYHKQPKDKRAHLTLEQFLQGLNTSQMNMNTNNFKLMKTFFNLLGKCENLEPLLFR